ncbi:MAG: type IV pilin-like G/H family protein [Trichocoleus desertorum ATA4-8-CV12]|jgi:hypothetical protein|nr:type IV pilin-like G/H family protein [Trichocoleus desertorum ATA4-8-CV12]
MTQQTTPLERAKQGDPQAIADLMNRSLSPKGIKIKASVSGDCLMLVAESQSVPDHQMVTDYIRKGMAGLGAEPIKRVIIKGQAIGSNTPKWRENLSLGDAPPSNAVGLQEAVSSVKSPTSSRFGLLDRVRSLDVLPVVNSVLLLGILLATTANIFAPKKPPAVQWEYRVEGIDDTDFSSQMQLLGRSGWEVASARRATSGEGSSATGLYEVILKRPIYVSEREILAGAKSELLAQKQLAGQSFVRAVVLGQQTQMLTKTQFASSVSELGLGVEPNSEDYDFNIAIEDPTKVVVTGSSKNNALRSYAGALFAPSGEGIGKRILCESEQPSKTPPTPPQVADGELTCPSGSIEIPED